MTKKLALIGSGQIANFHIPALRAAGLEIAHCASSLNSVTINKFAAHHKIDNVWQDPEKLINAVDQWDGLVIAAATEPTLNLLNLAMASGKPILVEKPVSYDSALLSKYAETAPENVIVAYNRRHYNTVQKARDFVSRRNAVRATMTLPDRVSEMDQIPYDNVHGNSVHGLDILHFIFGNLTIEKIVSTNSINPFFGRQALLRSENGSLILLNLNWNAPSNFSLSIDDMINRIELSPFEKLYKYKGMDIIPPSKHYPVRQYIPKLVYSTNVFEGRSLNLKPGFEQQSEEFSKLLMGKAPKIGANLTDAFKTQSLANSIVNQIN